MRIGIFNLLGKTGLHFFFLVHTDALDKARPDILGVQGEIERQSLNGLPPNKFFLGIFTHIYIYIYML